MITMVRTADVHDGKGTAALAWAVKVAAHITENISGGNVQVVRNVGGPVWQLHWVGNYESLAAYEETMKTIEQDAGYLDLIGEAREQKLFISSSIVDRLYQSVG